MPKRFYKWNPKLPEYGQPKMVYVKQGHLQKRIQGGSQYEKRNLGTK